VLSLLWTYHIIICVFFYFLCRQHSYIVFLLLRPHNLIRNIILITFPPDYRIILTQHDKVLNKTSSSIRRPKDARKKRVGKMATRPLGRNSLWQVFKALLKSRQSSSTNHRRLSRLINGSIHIHPSIYLSISSVCSPGSQYWIFMYFRHFCAFNCLQCLGMKSE